MVFQRLWSKTAFLLSVGKRALPHVLTVASSVREETSNQFEYGLYSLKDRYSMDQVPQQNKGPKGTVADKGSGRVHIKKRKTDFHKDRFCTLNVTVRAVHPQNQRLLICFRGTPYPFDARVPISPILQNQMEQFDKRNIYVWDPKAYMNFPQFQVWYREFDYTTIQHDTGYRMLQADGYKALLSSDTRNEFKSDNLKLVVSPAECTDQVTPL